jgi:thioredoxin 1
LEAGVARLSRLEVAAKPPGYLKNRKERGTMAGQINDVTDATFDVEVLEADGAVLVDFWAPWCGPCRIVSPVLEQIHAERDDLRVVKLNVDENQQTAVKYEVLSIPTMILFKQGNVVKKLIGAQPKARIEAELELEPA